MAPKESKISGKLTRKHLEGLDRAELRYLIVTGMGAKMSDAYRLKDTKDLINWIIDRTVIFAELNLNTMLELDKDKSVFREGVLEYLKQLQGFARKESKAPTWPPNGGNTGDDDDEQESSEEIPADLPSTNEPSTPDEGGSAQGAEDSASAEVDTPWSRFTGEGDEHAPGEAVEPTVHVVTQEEPVVVKRPRGRPPKSAKAAEPTVHLVPHVAPKPEASVPMEKAVVDPECASEDTAAPEFKVSALEKVLDQRLGPVYDQLDKMFYILEQLTRTSLMLAEALSEVERIGKVNTVLEAAQDQHKLVVALNKGVLALVNNLILDEDKPIKSLDKLP